MLPLVARGLPTPRSPASCYLSEPTVKTHVGRLLPKLGLRDRVQAVIFAYESGLVRSGHTSTAKSPDPG